MKLKYNEAGKCPKCGSEDLNYGVIEFEGVVGNFLYYPYFCKNCGFRGEEWYELTFTGHEPDLKYEED